VSKQKKLLKKERTALVIIDMQEKLLPHVWRSDFIVENLGKLIQSAQVMDLPIVATEHYPRGLGITVSEISGFFEDFQSIEKIIFGAVDVPEVLARLKEMHVNFLLIAGIETHICIMQTALQAIREGFQVHVVSDAVSSRTEENWRVGLERIRDAGGTISSTEMAIYELLYQAGTREFKEVLKFIVE